MEVIERATYWAGASMSVTMALRVMHNNMCHQNALYT